MNTWMLSALLIYLSFTLGSRLHRLPLRWNRFWIWLPCIGNALCLAVTLAQLDSESTKFLLAPALFAAALALSVWGIVNNRQERTQRGVEFIGLQVLALSLPVLTSRIEWYVLGWLASSWLWLYWDRDKRQREASPSTSKNYAWNRMAVIGGDAIFFLGLSLFFAAGENAQGQWMFPSSLNPLLSAAMLLVWAACLWRLALPPLTALFEDSRLVSDEKDLPYAFMQSVGFAFPAVHLLLDNSTGLKASFFSTLVPYFTHAVGSLSIATALASVLIALAARRTRAALAALSLNGWMLWAGALPQLQWDWALVCAFQICIGLALSWVLCTHIESVASVSKVLRAGALALVTSIVGGWSLLIPSSLLFFQYSRFPHNGNDGSLIPDFWVQTPFFFLIAALSLLSGRLVTSAVLWGESEIRRSESGAVISELALLVSGIFFVSLDLLISASLGVVDSRWNDLLLFSLPALLPFLVGSASAKWMAPPLLVRAASKPQAPARPLLKVADTLSKRLERLAWYSPALLLHSSSRALATASNARLWFAVLLLGAALLFTKVLP